MVEIYCECGRPATEIFDCSYVDRPTCPECWSHVARQLLVAGAVVDAVRSVVRPMPGVALRGPKLDH